jgi:hypothetical protein
MFSQGMAIATRRYVRHCLYPIFNNKLDRFATQHAMCAACVQVHLDLTPSPALVLSAEAGLLKI